jgi:hypothetical protein
MSDVRIKVCEFSLCSKSESSYDTSDVQTIKPLLAFHWTYQSEQTDCQFSDVCTQKLLKQTNKQTKMECGNVIIDFSGAML